MRTDSHHDSPIRAISTIPELAEAVLLYLTRPQIQILRLVSKQWFQLCEPHFYIHYYVKHSGSLLQLASPAFNNDSHDDMNDENEPSLQLQQEQQRRDNLLSSFHSPIDKEGIRRHRQCIRSITLWSYKDDPVRLLGRFCANSLVKLILMEATRESIDTLAIILPYMNELRTLEVRPMTRDAGADLLLAALSNMPNNKRFESFKFGLRRLGMISLRWSVLIEFLKNATGLKNLSLGTIDFLSDNEDSSSSPSSPCFRGGSSDVQQEENENHESIQDRILCTTLTTDPRNRSTPAPPGPFRNILQLQLGNSVMSRSQVIDFMSMLPNLSTIDLRFGLGSWSPLFLESLMATGLVQFPTLRRLNLTWYTGIEHMVLAWFLEASPNLQHLSLAGQWASDGSSGLGKMAEVLQQRQNRIRLRSLKCLWSDHLSEGTADLIAFLSLETCQDLEEIELSQNPSFMTNLLEAHERELEKERQQREQLHLPTATTPTGNNSNTRDSASSFLTPQPEQERPWFRFSRSLTSLRLTGYHGQAASPELTKTLNRLLRQFPRLIDLAITVYFQSYALFDSLGHCPGTTTERTHLLQIDSNVNDWLEERPFLQRLSIRFDDGFRIVPEEFQREIVDRFRFLDSIQLVAEVKGEDENKVFEAWRRRLRPGLQLRFSSEMESLSEQLSL